MAAPLFDGELASARRLFVWCAVLGKCIEVAFCVGASGWLDSRLLGFGFLRLGRVEA